MDRWLRGFIAVSLASLFAGGALGLFMVTAGASGTLLFAHVHLLLVGFMSFMVFGVGYFILPRFNATTLRFPGWVKVHFVIATAGLAALIAGQSLVARTGKPVVAAGAALELAGFAMFALNLLLSLGARAAAVAAPVRVAPDAAAPRGAALPVHPGRLTPDTPIGELLRFAPEALDILVGAGLRPLADPEHRALVAARGLSLGYACERHGIDVATVIAEIERSAPRRAPAITATTVIGEVLDAFPATRTVFQRYFGDGCFSCPGQAQETVAQAALMHDVAPELLLAELRRAAGE